MAEKILIVDDDLDTLRLVGLLLQRKGYQILAADNGLQALEKASSETPDLILLDVMMPDMDGVEVLRRLRADGDTSEIPIIMFTAKTQVEDKVTGFEAGADDYLTKPTHPAELTARVKTILARSASKGTTSSQPSLQLEKGKVIGVLGVKGGLGTTTIATNLGVMLHETTDETVIVADYRPGMGSLSLSLGYNDQDNLTTLLKKNRVTYQDVHSAILEHTTGIHILPSSLQPSDAKFASAVDQFVAITRHLATLGKFVVLDLGPGLPPTTEKVIELCDQLIVVIEPVLTTIIQTKALLEELSMKVLGLGRIQVVQVNRIRIDTQLSLREIQDRLGHAVSVVINPAPELAYQASQRNTPLILLQRDSLVAQQFKKLTDIAVKA